MQKDVKAERTQHPEGLPVLVIDACQVWTTLRISSSIPLGRFEWQWMSNGHIIRDSSTSARVLFQTTSVLPPSDNTKQPHDWYLIPYVYVFIISAQELDKTGSDSWNRLRVFVESSRNQLHEFLVICTTTQNDLVQHKRLFDKLRSEVNNVPRSSDRVVTISLADIREDQRSITNLHHSAAHREFLLRLREVVRESVQTRLQNYDKEVSLFNANRNTSSWSFNHFLVLKEGMLFVFLHLGRKDLCIKHYETLYAILFEQGAQCNVFCDMAAADVAQGISNPELRDYRAKLLDNTITEIELYTYIFARQMNLLLLDRKYTAIAEKGVKFINRVSKRCSEEVASEKPSAISRVFRDIWVFTAVRIISAALAPAVPSPNDSLQDPSSQRNTIRERHAVRFVAGFHVQALKALQNLAQVVLPGCLNLAPREIQNREALLKEATSTSNEKLRAALSSRKAAETLYSEIANAAASLYEMGYRARGAAALDGDAGEIHLINGSYTEAEALLSAQCNRFVNDHGWDVLHRQRRGDLAEAEKHLNRAQEYLISCLTMMYMCRKSRLLDPLTVISKNDAERLREEATRWVSEASSTAGNLPRMLRYKAERLFQISVLPNNKSWEDGSPGSAVVRIKSDIPADISFDYVLMECKCLDAPSVHKPVLQRREESIATTDHGEFSKLFGTGSPFNTSNVMSPASPSDTGASDVVYLKSETSVILKAGTNDILVSTSEIPHEGRFRVNLVTIYLGKLKFVYAVSKIGISPVAVTQGNGNIKASPFTASMSPLVDYAVIHTPIPFFHATKRAPSAIMELEETDSLYLVPQVHQYVSLKIIAGEKGIAKGSKLSCFLIGMDQNEHEGCDRFVQFCNDHETVESPQKRVMVLRMEKVTIDDNEAALDAGEAFINDGLQYSQSLLVKIGLNVLNDKKRVQDYENGSEFNAKKCALRLNLEWTEQNGNMRRRFSNKKKTTLKFAPPVEVKTQLELNSDLIPDSISSAIELDEPKLGNGGTLLCSIFSRTKPSEELNILSVALETPNWLEMRPDEEPAHKSLLPCVLQKDGLLDCAFDVFVKDKLETLEINNREEPNEFFQYDAMKHRLSRRIKRYSKTSANRDDGDLQNDGQRGTENMFLQEDLGKETEDYSNKDVKIEDMSKSINKYRNDTDFHPNTITQNDSDSKVAEVVVDLSSGEHVFVESVDTITLEKIIEQDKIHDAYFLAKLKIELKIKGIVEETKIERQISMKALRSIEKRFGIERRIKQVGEVGKVLDMEFRVWSMGSGDDIDDQAEILHYELHADPSVWVVAGRQRGQVEVRVGNKEVGGGTGSAKILAVQGGRHSAPRILLFDRDGRSIPNTRQEDITEYIQVLIISCRNVVSACRCENVSLKNGKDEETVSAGGNMPVVIASDSFFGA